MADAYVQELSRLVNDISTSSARQERIFLEERLKAEKVELDDASAKLAAFSSKNQMLNAPEQAKVAAAAAEMQAVQGVYAENSTRMRELRARMHELPQLGLQYAELYRRATIAEAVFEALTKQYEFAKVQEAKDVPAVRAVDAANVPERKAGPRRSMVVLVALFLSFLAGSVWIVGADLWDNIDPSDERKLYMQSVARKLHLDRGTGGPNGSLPRGRGGPSLGNGA